MKTRFKIATMILSVLACLAVCQKSRQLRKLLRRRMGVIPDSQQQKVASPFKTLPPALETQELVGVRSF